MDPWSNSNSVDREDDDNFDGEDLRFEDNFKPEPNTISEHLPDSEEYLAILQSRLERIKRDPDLIKQLSDKREACMQQLLSSSNGNHLYEEDLSLETPVNNSALIRTIVPQRTALNQGEIVELIKYDQLINQSDEENEKQLT